jgi:DNA-binding NarL/FixJ family response regulator
MPLTILVADDDLGTRLAISDYLELAGYSMLQAENGREALALVEQYQPHLIVTDISMPQMDGYQFVRELRRRPSFRLLPVVFLTARTDSQDRIQGYQTGCDVYLSKPFELQELGAVVRNLLERLQLIEAEWRSRAVPDKPMPEPELSFQEQANQSLETLKLTEREKQVLTVLAEGLSNFQIGEQLHLSPRTVEKHVSSLLRKTDTNNRAELVRFAMDRHLVE